MADVQVGGSGNTGQATIGNSKKLTKEEASYREDQGITGMRCGDCLFFQGGECQIVEGRIDEDDVCDQFEQNTKDGNVSAEMATQLRERPLALLDMWITRVSEDKQGIKRWFATSSGVKLDLYKEKMSIALFDDFVERIERGDPAPPPFISDAWQGGLPYLGIAHYLDLNGAGIIGPSEAVWVDNKVLKMKGTFDEKSPLAIAAYEAIQKDRLEERADQDRVRVSIAFIDWGHNHNQKHMFARKSLRDQCMFCEAGVRDKEYTAGQLVHLALTRRPAYPETEIVALEERSSMTKRRDDAASIVGDLLADDLEKRNKNFVGRATDGNGEVATGAIVIKDDSGGEKVSGESVERTLGGAQTLDDAEAFLTASANGDEPVLLDSWEILATVLGNLAGEEAQDAVRVVVKDFQNTLDVQTAQAVLEIHKVLGGEPVSDKPEKAVERQVPPQFRKDDEEAKRKRRPEEEEVEGELEAEDEDEDEDKDKKAKRKRDDEEGNEMKEKSVHVLDGAFAELREAYDEAIETPGDPVMKFAMIQDSFKSLGAEIQAKVAESVESAPVSAAAIARAVSEAIAPLQATVGALQAQIQAGATTKSTNPIPGRRAIKMPPALHPSGAVVRGEVDLTPTDQNETPNLRKIIRASTVGFEQRRGA